MNETKAWLVHYRAWIFVGITFLLTWGFWFATLYPQAIPAMQHRQEPLSSLTAMVCLAVGMAFPAIGVLLTRWITGEGFKNSWLRPTAFKQRWRYYLFGWFGPILLVLFGAVLFFLLNPATFDPGMSTYISIAKEHLVSQGISVSVSDDQLRLSGYAELGATLLAPLLNFVPCFGEEWGWRGYLLPKLMERHSTQYAIIVSGLIWGLWHAPVIVLGHNYGVYYFGWPVLGIIAMCVFAVCGAIFFSWLTLRAGNCLPAIFAHGALNGCAAAPVMFMIGRNNPFIGPVVTGIIGGAGFIIVAIICWILLLKHPVQLPQAAQDR